MSQSSSMLAMLAALAARPRAGNADMIQNVLARTERWSRAELERHQVMRLEELVRHAAANVPFYAGRLKPVGDRLTLERWREVPLLTREHLQQDFDAFASTSLEPAHRVVREARTSGSTGRPVRVRIDAVTDALDGAFGLRHHLWHRRDLTLKAASIRGFRRNVQTDTEADARWSSHPSSGPLVLLDVRVTTDEQLDWLLREAPAYLGTNATNAAALLARAEERKLRWSELRDVTAFAEVVPDGLRETCARVWGVPLADAYSTAELGFISFDCPLFAGHHVQSESVLVEVLRDDDSPCEPGEWGRVVVTALHAFAMPLIRYDLGDYALVGERCPCGRELPVLERILGRVRNMLVLPSGERVWPVFGGNTFADLAPVRQFRLVQRTLHELVLEVVAPRALSAEEEGRLRDCVLRTLRQSFTVEFVYVDAIPRSANGKFEEFRSDVPAGVQRSQ